MDKHILNFLALEEDEFQEFYEELDDEDRSRCDELIAALQASLSTHSPVSSQISGEDNGVDKAEADDKGDVENTAQKIKSQIYSLFAIVPDEELEEILSANTTNSNT